MFIILQHILRRKVRVSVYIILCEPSSFKKDFKNNSEIGVRLADKTYLDHDKSIEYLDKNASKVLIGSNLYENEYGHPLFADYFFFITGFHGFHVFRRRRRGLIEHKIVANSNEQISKHTLWTLL